jgi:hypothetical protein
MKDKLRIGDSDLATPVYFLLSGPREDGNCFAGYQRAIALRYLDVPEPGSQIRNGLIFTSHESAESFLEEIPDSVRWRDGSNAQSVKVFDAEMAAQVVNALHRQLVLETWEINPDPVKATFTWSIEWAARAGFSES